MPMPMSVAATLADAFRAFNPAKPLSGALDDPWYAPRPEGTDKLLSDLQADDSPNSKWLFTGHRGSGKSTELRRMAARLSGEYFTVYHTVEDVLDMADLDYKELLLSLGSALYAQARARGVKLPEALLEELIGWYSTTFREVEGTIGADADLQAKADFWLIKVSARAGSEVATREVIRTQLESRLSDLIGKLDKITAAIAERSRLPVLAMVDGLDKVLDLSRAERLYHTGGANLTQPRFKIIYTVPLALLHTNAFGQVRTLFERVYRLPNVKVRERNGGPHAPGCAALRDLLDRRMDRRLIAPEAAEALVLLSGGLPRELVYLTREACSWARARNASRIETPDVERAATDLRNLYAAMLTQAHHDELYRIHHDPLHRFTNSETAQELIHNLSLLEYADPEAWYDAHPIIHPLLRAPSDASP